MAKIHWEASQKLSMLRDEYLFLQQQYEDYDKRSLTIKGWVSSGAIAALALGFSDSYKLAYLIPIFVSVVVVMVWYLEAYWKLFQYALSDRIRILEAHFRGDDEILVKDPDPFQIYHWWFKSYASDKPIYEYESANHVRGGRPHSFNTRLRQAAFQKFVLIPYAPLLILCAVSLVVILAN